MDFPPPPPPLPSKAKSSDQLIIVACCIFAGLVLIGFMAAGFFFVRQQHAKREALAAVEKSAAEERAKMAEAARNGQTPDSEGSLGRMKDQLGKSASAMSGSDAAAARAMAVFLDRVQTQLREYTAALDHLKKEKVLSFNIEDRASIDTNRQIIHDFLASNAKLMNTMQHGGDLIRAELDAGKVSPQFRDATIAGFTRSQGRSLPLQLQIRRCDQTLGENSLAILDLLDENWGKWKRDEVSKKLRFEETAVAESFNDHIHKIQAAAAEQTKAQQEMLALAKATPAN